MRNITTHVHAQAPGPFNTLFQLAGSLASAIFDFGRSWEVTVTSGIVKAFPFLTMMVGGW